MGVCLCLTMSFPSRSQPSWEDQTQRDDQAKIRKAADCGRKAHIPGSPSGTTKTQNSLRSNSLVLPSWQRALFVMRQPDETALKTSGMTDQLSAGMQI